MLMASYATTISRLPLPSASLSRGRSWRPSQSVALKPSYHVVVKSRRPLSVTCALPERERPATFSIPPTALLCPVPPPDDKERWTIREDGDRTTLWLQVPGVSPKDIEVTKSTDVLEIRRKGSGGSGSGSGQEAAADVHGVGAFHIRLLVTGLYDPNKVTADLKEGMLEVIVYKNLKRRGDLVVLGAPLPGDASSGVPPPPQPKSDQNNKTKPAGPAGPSPPS